MERARGGRSLPQRDAWIAFEVPAAHRPGSPGPDTIADDKDHRWVVGYQRGEIIALVDRVRYLERRLKRRSAALVGTVALVALGVCGIAAYWISESLLAPYEAMAPSGIAASAADEPAPSPTATDQPRAGSPEPSPPLPDAGRRTDQLASLQADRPVATEAVEPPAQPGPPATAPIAVRPLPVQAPTRVTVNFPRDDIDAEQLAALLAQHLRGRGLSVDAPAPMAVHPSEAGIAYYFAEDREGAVAVERMLGGLLGKSRLVLPPEADPLPRPGSVVVVVPAG